MNILLQILPLFYKQNKIHYKLSMYFLSHSQSNRLDIYQCILIDLLEEVCLAYNWNTGEDLIHSRSSKQGGSQGIFLICSLIGFLIQHHLLAMIRMFQMDKL